MKKLSLFFTLLLIFSSSSLITSQVKINIVVTSNNVKSNEQIFISGNKPELGNWNPAIIGLEKINDSTYAREFKFNEGEVIEFKFTKGSWDSEALNDNESTPGNIIIKVLHDTSINYRINHWKNSRSKIAGQITGKVIYHNNFKGKNILPRNIIVWLPPSYDSLPNKHYPVLYMHDGQNIFDPATSSFGVDWQIDETADSLIKSEAIREIIIVGIYNTYQRRVEYVKSDTGYAYMKFIVDELKPFIDKTYRTFSDRNSTAVGGSSLGGLISFMLAWEYPNVFSMAACLSPAFKIDKIDYVSSVLDYSGPKKPIKFYIDNGGVGLDEKLQPGVDEMISALKEKGYEQGKDLYWFFDLTAEHNERAWSKRVWRFLEYFFSTSK